MINFVTNREYTGKNVDILMASGKGEEFAGFHQGKKFFGVKGTDLKGMKAAASVQFIVRTKMLTEMRRSLLGISLCSQSRTLRLRLLRIEFLTQIGK